MAFPGRFCSLETFHSHAAVAELLNFSTLPELQPSPGSRESLALGTLGMWLLRGGFFTRGSFKARGWTSKFWMPVAGGGDIQITNSDGKVCVQPGYTEQLIQGGSGNI